MLHTPASRLSVTIGTVANCLRDSQDLAFAGVTSLLATRPLGNEPIFAPKPRASELGPPLDLTCRIVQSKSEARRRLLRGGNLMEFYWFAMCGKSKERVRDRLGIFPTFLVESPWLLAMRNSCGLPFEVISSLEVVVVA